MKARAYDLVINGYEAAGSIRIHNPEVQARLCHITIGLDRMTMILAGTTNIRDVLAFPKNQKARDLMTGAPAPVDAKQLKELGL